MRTREICIEPPSRHVTYEPALYINEPYTCEVTPGYWQRVESPPVYETVTRRVCKTPERWEWQAAPAPAPLVQPAGPAAAPATK